MTAPRTTLIIGASTNTSRYSYKAAITLLHKGYKIALLGKDEGIIEGVPIINKKYAFKNIHTVTIYLNPEKQIEYYNYIISLKPQRVIFNPGTENHVFEKLLKENNIITEHRCTLVMLALNEYE